MISFFAITLHAVDLGETEFEKRGKPVLNICFHMLGQLRVLFKAQFATGSIVIAFRSKKLLNNFLMLVYQATVVARKDLQSLKKSTQIAVTSDLLDRNCNAGRQFASRISNCFFRIHFGWTFTAAELAETSLKIAFAFYQKPKLFYFFSSLFAEKDSTA